MPRRRPAPFWREQTRCWYVQLGKKQIRLSPDEEDAFRLYHELMASPAGGTSRAGGCAYRHDGRVDSSMRFLDWTQANRDPPPTMVPGLPPALRRSMPGGICACAS